MQAQNEPNRQLAFYEITNVGGKSDGNGRLPDTVWQNIPATNIGYVYWKMEPIPSDLKTDLQIAYDDQGIYLKITNYDENLDKIRAHILKRGNPSLWTDDCIELYIDPQASAVGYMVFTINSLGVQMERKQQDTAVSINEWRGDNWQTWASKTEDAWVIEISIPFADMDATAEPGSFWMFNAVRYAYSSGKFQGATWSPGANYDKPGYFGYLYFGDKETTSAKAVANLLQEKVTPPWIISVNNKILWYEGEEKVEILSPPEAGETALQAAENIFTKLEPFQEKNPELAEQLNQLKQETKSLTFPDADTALESMREISNLTQQAWILYWNASIEALINTELEN